MGSGRFDYLDGIRAVAIGAVLSLHWLSWYSPFFHGGSIGVDVFFVLSGFIITTMLWRSPAAASLGAAWWAFVRRRVVRLYPALLDTMADSGVHTAVALVALPNPGSVALHTACGFEHVGTERLCGFKLGEWADVGRWQKDLAPRLGQPQEPRLFADVWPSLRA